MWCCLPACQLSLEAVVFVPLDEHLNKSNSLKGMILHKQCVLRLAKLTTTDIRKEKHRLSSLRLPVLSH